jgi:Ser/Thr protein kinase RdoA (MazF antagonist)
MLYAHSDLHAANVLFENGKIRGIIDFENIGYAPRIRDLSLSIKSGCDTLAKERRFMKGYESVLKLTKKEKKLIPLITLRDNCYFFDRFYGGKGNAKDEKERIKRNMSGLNWVIGSTKKMVERTGILEKVK